MTEHLPPIRGFSWLQDFISNTSVYQNRYIRLGFFTLGAGLALFKTLSLTKAILSPLFRFNRDLAARYGRDSWVVITGASDGIGKGYAFEFARRGFNIVLVGRNEEKLGKVAQELKAAVPQVQTRIVVADFSQAYKEGFAEDIHSQVKGLDVSILINNAGVYVAGDHLQNVPSQTIINVVMTNCLSHALITRAFLPQLAARTNRSAIINLSSIAGSVPVSYITIYSATKAFLDFLSRGNAYEHPNIDTLSLKPAFISTKMIDYKKASLDIITVDEFIPLSLRKLGHVTHSIGHWKHILQWVIFVSYPEFLRGDMVKERFLKKD